MKILDIPSLHQEIEHKYKWKDFHYVVGWVHAIHDEIKHNEKGIWSQQTQAAILKILSPITKSPSENRQIFPQILKQLRILEVAECTSLIPQIAAIITDFNPE